MKNEKVPQEWKTISVTIPIFKQNVNPDNYRRSTLLIAAQKWTQIILEKLQSYLQINEEQ